MKINQIRIAFILACHNRKNITINSIQRIYQFTPKGMEFEYCITDDGSSDGTGDEIANNFPDVKVVRGNGYWFWTKSMLEAEKTISNVCSHKIYLNDDVILQSNSIQKILDGIEAYPTSILVGSLFDYEKNCISYSGLRKIGRNPSHFSKILPNGSYQDIDTFHGNLVVFPIAEMSFLHLNSKIVHNFADVDFGLRIHKRNISIKLFPDIMGTCEIGPRIDKNSNFFERAKHFFSPKGTPLKSQFYFFKEHGGAFWPIYFLFPLIRLFLNIDAKNIQDNLDL